MQREFVIHMEGFGSGPGCGWFVQFVFLGLHGGGYSVFRRCDGVFEEEESFGDAEWEDYGEEEVTVARRVATDPRELTWRRALEYALRDGAVRAGRADQPLIRLKGGTAWQRAVMKHALRRDRRKPYLWAFFRGREDAELELLHEALGGLTSARALRRLAELKRALREAGLEKVRLERAAELAGVEARNVAGVTAGLARLGRGD